MIMGTMIISRSDGSILILLFCNFLGKFSEHFIRDTLLHNTIISPIIIFILFIIFFIFFPAVKINFVWVVSLALLFLGLR